MQQPKEKDRQYNSQKKRTDNTTAKRKGQTIQQPKEKDKRICNDLQNITQKTKDLRIQTLLKLPVQSVPITTNVVSTNPTHGKVYSIQHYVIKFVSDMQQIRGFLRVLQFPPPIKLTATM
jgi:hypothetical protein